jgi:predicted DNA binding CopG/RHH family protein
LRGLSPARYGEFEMSEAHRIQVRVGEKDWQRAERAATKRGLSTVAALCRYLLEEEFVRQGMGKDHGTSARESAAEEEHRIQVRVKDTEWQLAQRAAQARGLPTVSALCRSLLEKEFARFFPCAAAES